MKKPSFSTEEFPWTGENDDYTCRKFSTILRVEQLDEGKWWWSCGIEGKPEFDVQDTCTSKYRAIGCCEGYYWALIAMGRVAARVGF